MKPLIDASAIADLRRLLLLFRPYWRWMVAGAALSFAMLLANVALMAIAGWFIASMALAGVTHAAFDYFTPAALIRGCAIVRTVGRYAERLVTHEATLRVLAKLRVWFHIRIEPLSPARLQHVRGADLLTRIHADIDSLNHFYLRVLLPVAVGAVGALTIVVAMAFFSVPVAGAALVFLLLAGVALPAFVLRRTHEPARIAVEQRAELYEAVVDNLQGLGELKVYGAANAYASRIERLSTRLVESQSRLSTTTGWSQGLLIACASLAMWCVLFLSIPRVSSGALPPAELAMLALFVLASFEAVAPISTAVQLTGESLAAARRIFELVDVEPMVRDPDEPPPLPERNDLSIAKLSFRYDGSPTWALRDVSFDLPAGARIAIVGASGAGKSTLVNLLLRFWDYQQGTIRLGGAELRQCAAEAVRSRIAVVSQETYLFNDTIRANLLIARPDADQARLEAACRDAQLHDFIAGLPDGYDTQIGEAGTRLSGGQARRLAIARALLLDAPILVLDEPTEGLDTVTEQALLDTVLTLMAGRSVLLITHRLSALAAGFDAVLAMDDGRIVDRRAVTAANYTA
jgi:ATP-binding cassette subfamily C protein CydC